MTGKAEVYQCRVCGTTLQVLRRGRAGLSCCGEPLEFSASGGEVLMEEPSPLLDLVEVRVEGKSYWQFPASGIGAGVARGGPINYL